MFIVLYQNSHAHIASSFYTSFFQHTKIVTLLYVMFLFFFILQMCISIPVHILVTWQCLDQFDTMLLLDIKVYFFSLSIFKVDNYKFESATTRKHTYGALNKVNTYAIGM